MIRTALASPAADSWAGAWLASAAALVIGVGAASPEPTAATAVALLACMLAGLSVLGTGRWLSSAISQRAVVMLGVTTIAMALFANVVSPPLRDARYLIVLLLAGSIGIAAMLQKGRLHAPLVVVALLLQFALACVMIAALEVPDIDVHMFQQEGSAALLSGENPYSLRYKNTAGFGTGIYAPELQVGDRLAFGFPYPPLSLLMAVPGYVIGGDYRYGAAAAVFASALLIWNLRRGPVAAGAGLLLAFSPLTFRVLYYGWTEPFVVLWLAVTLLAVARTSVKMPIALGLLVATKQYVAPVLILAPIILSHLADRIGRVWMIVIAMVVIGLTSLPFLFWHPTDFLFSVAVVQTIQPLRFDSASIPGALARMGIALVPQWVAFAAAGIAIIVVSVRASRTPAGFAGAIALTFIVFFLFSKQAFGNYYFFPMGALACAMALTMPVGNRSAASHAH